jgi:hypothetical protein
VLMNFFIIIPLSRKRSFSNSFFMRQAQNGTGLRHCLRAENQSDTESWFWKPSPSVRS